MKTPSSDAQGVHSGEPEIFVSELPQEKNQAGPQAGEVHVGVFAGLVRCQESAHAELQMAADLPVAVQPGACSAERDLGSRSVRQEMPERTRRSKAKGNRQPDWLGRAAGESGLPIRHLILAALLLIAAVACDTEQPGPAQVPAISPTATAETTVTESPAATPVSGGQPTAVLVQLPTRTHASERAPAATSTPLPIPTAAPRQAVPTPGTAGQSWRGLIIESEYRCSPYDADDYPYSQSVEPRIVADMGGIIYGPYTGSRFSSTRETDIEHIVARSEAHDSGLCAAGDATRRRFSSDLLNLTLASPSVNRHQKSGKDAAEWLPDLNQCWFANRVVQVKREYGLTVDAREASALDAVLSGCSSFELVVVSAPPQARPTPVPSRRTGSPSNTDPLSMYDDNDNGRITCAEARAHRIAPVHSDHPAYQHMRDGDGDGIVCE